MIGCTEVSFATCDLPLEVLAPTHRRASASTRQALVAAGGMR